MKYKPLTDDELRYTNKTHIPTLLEQARRSNRLAEAVTAYEREQSSPVKDYILIQHRRQEMFKILAAYLGDDE